MRYKFVGKEDMIDGTPTLGVVYHMLRERDIREAFEMATFHPTKVFHQEPPKVLGYIVIEKEEGEDNENET